MTHLCVRCVNLPKHSVYNDSSISKLWVIYEKSYEKKIVERDFRWNMDLWTVSTEQTELWIRTIIACIFKNPHFFRKMPITNVIEPLIEQNSLPRLFSQSTCAICLYFNERNESIYSCDHCNPARKTYFCYKHCYAIPG